MFEYKKKSSYYWITSDNIKWNFWPFSWIYIKNKYIWDIDKGLINENKFPGYKYSIWIYNNTLFIIWLNGIEKINFI